MIIYNKKKSEACRCQSSFIDKVNFILSVSCNNEDKLCVTFQFSLVKGTASCNIGPKSFKK